MRPLRPKTIALAVLAISVAGAALAQADERTREDPNDASGRMDIREAKAGHAPDGRLRHLVETTGRWGPTDLLSKSGPPGSVCIHVWTDRRPAAGPPDYLACAGSDAKGKALEGWVTRVSRRAGRTGRSTRAAISRPGSRAVVLRFSQSQIGRPDLPRASGHILREPEATTGP